MITEWEFWRDWLTTGKALIWIFLYASGSWMFFDLTPMVTVRPLQWLARLPHKPLQVDNNLLRGIFVTLSRFGLSDCDRKTQWIKATRYTSEMIEFLEDVE